MIPAIKDEFVGKPLVSKDVPRADFLVGSHGKAFLEEYKGRLKSDFNDNRTLDVLRFDEKKNVVIGSNVFAAVLANQILSQYGLRTATQADLERILRMGALDLQHHCEDSGLVLRSEYGANNYLAKHLAKQIKEVHMLVSPKNPLVISLNDLELRNDPDSDYGLVLRLKDGAVEFKIFYAPVLSKTGQFNSEDVDELTGLPKKTRKEGSRVLYTRSYDLSRLDLDRNTVLDSGSDNLSGSDSFGRIVVVKDPTRK